MKPADSREVAFDTLCRVEEGAFSDLALDSAFSQQPGMEVRDRALTTELVYGVLRQRGRLDFALAGFCQKPLAKVEPTVLMLLRLGAYQILFLDRVPDSAAVNETVELARRRKLDRATGFINGILRALIRGREKIRWPSLGKDPRAHLRDVLSLPPWLADKLLSGYGPEEAAGIAGALLQPPPFTLRVNTLKIGRDDFLREIGRHGHPGEPTRYAPEGVVLTGKGRTHLPGDAEGWYQVQDEASMLISHLLGPEAGEQILDACAAPGGKTTHIAALSENGASVTALDLHPRRVRLVEEGARRLGCRGIAARTWDLTNPPSFLQPRSFDRVLVDAPCSGLGVLRRNPEIRWRRTGKDIREMAELQRTILDRVANLVRPGGVLLYSLCTFTAEETTEVTDDFLKNHPDFVAEDLRREAPDSWASLFDEHGRLRTWPHRHGGMDAFFAVRFRRRDG